MVAVQGPGLDGPQEGVGVGASGCVHLKSHSHNATSWQDLNSIEQVCAQASMVPKKLRAWGAAGACLWAPSRGFIHAPDCNAAWGRVPAGACANTRALVQGARVQMEQCMRHRYGLRFRKKVNFGKRALWTLLFAECLALFDLDLGWAHGE